MDTLTVAEYAELKKCTARNIRKQISNGKIAAIETLNQRNKKIFLIPFNELSEDEKISFLKKRGVLMTPKISENIFQLEEMTAEERAECSFWEQTIKEWKDYRNTAGYKSKAEADAAYIAIMKGRYPDISISTDILYRKYKYLKNGDLKGLVDKRGKAKKGYTKIDDYVWQVFLSFLLDQAKHPLRKCYKYMKIYVQNNRPELLEDIPAYCTFTRHVKKDVPDALLTLGRDGEKAFDDRCAPYIKRTYDNIASNDYWVGDNHTIDVIVGDERKTFRLYLTAYMDVRSGIFTGIYLTDNPSSQASIYALRRGIMSYGIPKNLYLDNGREFLTFDFGGLGHRAKRNDDRFAPPPVLERLGIHMVNAGVRNAKAKIIERRFLDFKNSISRLFCTYTGGNVVEKPEILKVELKNGNIPNKAEFIQQIENMIYYYLNFEEYNGAVVADRGKRKIDIWKEHIKDGVITATEDQLNLMLMRSTREQKVTRSGVRLMINGARIDYCNNEMIMQLLNKEVYVRYDPDNLEKVRVYDLEDRFIMEVDRITPLPYGATKEQVKTAMAQTRSFKKAAKQAIKGSVIANIDRNTALELVLAEAQRNKEEGLPSIDDKLVRLKQEDETALLYKMPAVDLEKMNRNAIKRKGGNKYA